METLFIIIVEDEREILNNVTDGLRDWLIREHSDIACKVLAAASFEDIELFLEEDLDLRSALSSKSGRRVCAVLDNTLEGSSKSGVEITDWLRAKASDVRIIGYSSHHGEKENYKRFIEHGAVVVDKNFTEDNIIAEDNINEIIARIRVWVQEHAGIKDEIEEYLRQEFGAYSSACDDLINKTALNVRATKPAGIIFGGHFGCGKNYFAEIVHGAAVKFGYRKDKKTLVNITEDSRSQNPGITLFGIARGSNFEEQEGAFRKTEGGTLIIDEIGNYSRKIQTNLLSAIDPGSFTPELSSDSIDANSWVIMTTSKPENIIPELRDRFLLIMMPSIGERKEDIPLIIDNILKKQSEHQGCNFSLGVGARQLLESQAWRSFRNIRDTLFYTCQNKISKTPGSSQIGPDEIIWKLDDSTEKENRSQAETSNVSTDCFYETPSGIIVDPRISMEIAQDGLYYIRDRWLGKDLKETPGQLRNRDSTLAAAVYLHFFAQLWPARQEVRQTRANYSKVFSHGMQESIDPHRNLAKDARKVIRLRNTSKNITQSLIQDEIAPAFWRWCQEHGLVCPNLE